MFRCITELKGLAIDIDSFKDVDISVWKQIDSIVKCVFISSSEDTQRLFAKEFDRRRIIEFEEFVFCFLPNKKAHLRVLKALGIQNTELAYLSSNFTFIENAHSFLSGTIWITQNVSYEQASKAPDIILDSVEQLQDMIKSGLVGLFGEIVLSPIILKSHANILTTSLFVDNETIAIYVLGRYYSNNSFLGYLHPYSIALSHNKIPDRKYTGVFDNIFTTLYIDVISELKKIYDIDCVCSVPVKPGRHPRFDDILNGISRECSISNINKNLTCVRDYPNQKSLSAAERKKNVEGVFEYSGNLESKNVVLIDDISSTGSTICECIRVLKKHGASKVIVVLLAINQIGSGAYWSSELPEVKCPACNSKMQLRPSHNRAFFFSCNECFREGRPNQTLSFEKGWKQLCENENSKIRNLMNSNIEVLETESDEDGTIRIERIIKCPCCFSENVVDLVENSQMTEYERQMGKELLIEYDEERICETCGRKYHIDGYVSIYPTNVIDNEEINIESVDEEL